jgi:2-amino-4-hydroxy-6-hydroxymethyldihydropteridine diphosphokinase
MYRKRKLNDYLTSFSSLRFPYVKKYPKNIHRYETFIGIGGNVGDVKRRFEQLFIILQKEKRIELLRTSLILKNPPFGYKQQDDFLNAIIVLKTSMQARRFLSYLLHLEKRFGRKRSFANAPRTLDLDIIFFDNRTVQTEALQLPHPHWYKRESVVIPLVEVL